MMRKLIEAEAKCIRFHNPAKLRLQNKESAYGAADWHH